MLNDGEKRLLDATRYTAERGYSFSAHDMKLVLAIVERLTKPETVLAEAERLLRILKTPNGVMRVSLSNNDCGCCESFVRAGIDEIAGDDGVTGRTLPEAYAKLLERDGARREGR